MKKVVINNTVLELYDGIEELPIVNFQKFNKYMLIDSGIGSDFEDVNNHISTLARLIKSSDKVKALQELQNMRQNMFMVISNISPKHMAFSAFIHSVNGQKVTDLSDENLKRILDSLRTVKRSKIINLLVGLKKKVQTELVLYFPAEFNSAKNKEAYDQIKRRTLLVLEGITTGKDMVEEIEKIDATLFAGYKPKSFAGAESAEIGHDKSFEETCLLISQETHVDAKTLTTLAFYSALETIKKQVEAKNKSVSKISKK